MDQPIADPLAELITTYNELNSPVIEELDEEPSPLEFMRYVSRNTPFVVRKAAATWSATKNWNAQYLEGCLRDQTVNVAVTPRGNADAPTWRDEDGELVFAKPWEEDQAFPEFLDHVRRQEIDASFPQDSEIRYAQTQNDNLRHEYDDVIARPKTSTLQLTQTNNRIGNSRSVTALHKDNYENIYVQIRGQKHFVLLPPHSHPCVNEKPLRPGTYAPNDDSQRLQLVMDAGDGSGQEVQRVPFAIWDPDCPDDNATPYSRLAEPMRVTLEPGDMLYLPAMW
ncbi:hypothetical protein SLS53_000315 [Cytospora paraplurivora]|uniref:JmjC domain-containing protein n=1 Tax=Cytospora paraplurivora TaxID=2898453 RepID=A0AAN9YMM4_9PEZI